MSPGFATTQWSVVLSARDGSEDVAREALEALCEDYWYPLYAYVRGLGHSVQDANDLTQGFFAELLEKDRLRAIDPSRGRFRSFLLASLKHYISHQWKRGQAQRRGGGTQIVPLDVDDAETRYSRDPVYSQTPELIFERHWGQTVMELALQKLRRGRRVEQLDRLVPYVTGAQPQVSYARMASELGTSTSAIKSAVHRLRKRFGRLLREEIAQTVADPDDVDDELRHLLTVVQPWAPAEG